MGAILAIIATTLLEISVSIISSFQGKGSLALGNALGSVLFNIAVILGISSVFRPIKVDDKGWRNALSLLILSGILGLMALNKYLSRWEGLVLIILYGIFLKRSIEKEEIYHQGKERKIVLMDIAYVFIMGGVVVLGSKFLVDSDDYWTYNCGFWNLLTRICQYSYLHKAFCSNKSYLNGKGVFILSTTYSSIGVFFFNGLPKKG
ncbi:MAG: sodium:calcium antiporter [Dictyoglomus turgidum]|uniref:sodium:calcium antiporter n=1 Tax=Dictyoglomus turgidum TaxID=513050 RepID=UPI003C738786